MRIWIGLIGVLVAGTAHADVRKELGDGYRLAVESDGVWVHKGTLRARLAEARGIASATLDKQTRVVTAEIEDFGCYNTTKYRWPLGELDARMENWAAFALHKKGDDKGAAAGFARAVAADPTWKIPAINLASARALLGERDAAIAALAPWLASEPVATYVTIATDPDLASLRDRAEVRALRAATPGSVQFANRDLVGRVAVAKQRGLVAVVRGEASWGASAFHTDVEIFDVKAGARVASLPLVEWAETSPDCYKPGCEILPAAKPVIEARGKRIAALLGELGFVAATTEAGSQIERTADDKFKTTFAAAKLGVVERDGTARVLQKDATLATGATFDHLHAAVYLAEPRAVIVWSGRAGREGCEGANPTLVTVLPL
jgi:hypothetical protein